MPNLHICCSKGMEKYFEDGVLLRKLHNYILNYEIKDLPQPAPLLTGPMRERLKSLLVVAKDSVVGETAPQEQIFINLQLGDYPNHTPAMRKSISSDLSGIVAAHLLDKHKLEAHKDYVVVAQTPTTPPSYAHNPPNDLSAFHLPDPPAKSTTHRDRV